MIYSAIRDEEGNVTDWLMEYANNAVAQVTGAPTETYVGKALFENFPAHPEIVNRAMEEIAATGGQTVLRNVIYSGEALDGELQLSYDVSVSKCGDGVVVVVRDPTQPSYQHHRPSHRARHDGLTGLLNRTAFLEQLEEAVAAFKADSTDASLLILDLDQFKAVNDRFGHLEGDRALESVARLIESNIRETDFAARLGGDEFAILMPGASCAHGEALAEKLVKQVTQMGLGLSGELITASIGTASCEEVKPADHEDLLRAADRTLYEAKADGGNGSRRATP